MKSFPGDQNYLNFIMAHGLSAAGQKYYDEVIARRRPKGSDGVSGKTPLAPDLATRDKNFWKNHPREATNDISLEAATSSYSATQNLGQRVQRHLGDKIDSVTQFFGMNAGGKGMK